MLKSRRSEHIESQSNNSKKSSTPLLLVLVLCTVMLVLWSVRQIVRNQPTYAESFAPNWIPLIAIGFTVAGILRIKGYRQWSRLKQLLHWSGLFLMIWTANGLPFDLLGITGLIPSGIDWFGLTIRTLALVITLVLVRIDLSRTIKHTSAFTASWYGYAAFLLALPYPVIRTFWAFGGTIGLSKPGVAGSGFTPWLASLPWLLAAVLSLLLVSTSRRMPRRLLIVAGWTATTIVAMIGPSACWSLVTKLVEGSDLGLNGMATWVPCLFYGSWLLWGIAAGAATFSYQVRSSKPVDVLSGIP